VNVVNGIFAEGVLDSIASNPTLINLWGNHAQCRAVLGLWDRDRAARYCADDPASARAGATAGTTAAATVRDGASGNSSSDHRRRAAVSIVGVLVGLAAAGALIAFWRQQRRKRNQLGVGDASGRFSDQNHHAAAASANMIGAEASVLLRQLQEGSKASVVGGAAKNRAVMAELAAAVKGKAEAQFVLMFRQLVAASSMEEFQASITQLEVARSAVQLHGTGGELGRGQSGVVFSGTMSTVPLPSTSQLFISDGSGSSGGTGSSGGAGSSSGSIGGGPRQVAVKACIGTATGVGVDASVGADSGASAGHAIDVVGDVALLVEALLLNGLRHPSIISLVAVVTDSMPVMLVTELMVNGDLRKLLRSSRPHKAERRTLEVTPLDMVAVAAKVVSAMAFLEERAVIHRDLAARNVLVGATASDVRLADLGAARSVHRTLVDSAYTGVYVAQTDHNPARWMALEALQQAKFSHKSDVFAFGVLLWEVITYAKTPWGAYGVRDFSKALANGERLERPHDAAEGSALGRLYGAALRCWATNPLKRPPFRQLCDELSAYNAALVAQHRSSGARGGADDRAIPSTSAEEPTCEVLLLGSPYSESGASAQPKLDSQGYVLDASAAVVAGSGNSQIGTRVSTSATHGCTQPSLDRDGYVEEQAHGDARC
jgi:hypothetical protein